MRKWIGIKWILYIIMLVLLVISEESEAQTKFISGLVKDGHSDEFLPFASVRFKNSTVGKIADSSGAFSFQFTHWPSDTLVITSISYEPYYFLIPHNKDTVYIMAAMQAGKANAEVIVKARQKHSRGWYLWRKVVAHKDSNNIFKNDNFTYNVYNKLELDLNNINAQKLQKKKLLKPFGFIFNNVDSLSEEKPVLPTFLTETVSKFYYNKNPHKTREVISASRVSGISNPSFTKYLGGLYQNIIIYANFIPVFDKKFVSPISDNGDNYYDYKLADTQWVAGRRLLHLVFIPKHAGENTFTGDCWVHDTTFAIQKVILHINKEANINYVDKLSLVQEFKLINDSTWFLSKDKFIVNLNPIGSKAPGFIARKTTTYDNVIINTSEVTTALAKNKVQEEVEVLQGAEKHVNNYWDTARQEPLSKSEKGIYAMMDSIQQSPAYKKYYNTVFFLSTGYKNIGKVQIGPWFSWVSANAWEGTRIRFDLGTTAKFSKKIWLHSYLAYGFKDQQLKGKGEALWLLKSMPRQILHASYSNDLDYSQNSNTNIPSDNFLAVAIRKSGIPIKFIKLKEYKIQYSIDNKIGLRTTFGFKNKEYKPLKNIPDKTFFDPENRHVFNTTEASLKFRFAYLEKYYETNFFRYSLGSPYPIAEVEFTQGIKGILNSSYQYQKITFSAGHESSIAPFGKLYYHVFAGKIFGTLPYVLLEVHPGNEVYYYNQYAFNLMSKYEFISDQYAGFFMEHTIGNGLFRFIPLTRKLKFRQFWNVKAVTGNLTNANTQLNYVAGHTFRSLDNKLYLEAGTGVDNIFKVFRIDFIWRLLPTPLPQNKVSRFGIFGSFRLQL